MESGFPVSLLRLLYDSSNRKELFGPTGLARSVPNPRRVAFYGEVNKVVDEGCIRHATCGDHLRVHRNRSEPWHRVQLVKQHPSPVLLEEKVTPSEA